MLHFSRLAPALVGVLALLLVEGHARGQGLLTERWTATAGSALGLDAGLPSLKADWDGDGHEDLLVIRGDVPGFFSLPPAESMDVVSGATGAVLASPPSLFSSPLATFIGWRARNFGLIDDVDGDGMADLAILRHATIGPEMALELRSGADTSLIHLVLWPVAFNFTSDAHLIDAGDMNGDGVSELAVTLPATAGGGEVRVVDPVSGAELATLNGPADSFVFGEVLHAVGDVDGDGLADLLCGGPLAVTTMPFLPPSGNVGLLRLVKGGTFATLWETTIPWGWDGPQGDFLGAAFRRSLLRDDLDGDGIPDLMVEKEANSGAWWLVSSGTGALIADLGILGGDFENAGDLNGDGVDDYAQVFSTFGSSTVFIDGMSDQSLGALPSLGFLLGLGDLNGDGFAEVLMQKTQASASTPATEVVRLARSQRGAERYGDLKAPLTLGYVAHPTAPRIELRGANSQSLLIAGWSPQPAAAGTTFAGIPLFIDLAAAELGLVTADAFGVWRLWTSLRVPQIAGLSVYLQVVETGTDRHSNGLELLFQF
jgi:hypothetical protein